MGNQLVDTGTGELKLLLDGMTALKHGDFSVRLPRDWEGLAGKIADTFNDVVEANQALSGDLERLSREVGKEGKLRQRAHARDFKGSWAGMVSSVNTLVEELVRPTSEMSRVIGAVAKGDLSQSVELEAGGRPLEGEFLKTAKTVNTMVALLGSFASEVTRVAREVGTEGKLGGQATVKDLSGTWRDLTDSVNSMASNLTGQVRNIAEVTIAVANGDLSKKITVDVRGEILQLKETINTMVDQLRSFASEVTRVAREVGTEGKLGGQAVVPGVAGTWKDLTDNVNFMASNLTGQVRNIAEVTTAVARGDLGKKITVDVKGEILELKNTINTMVDQLSSFASEVTRVAREVGTEGKLGGQATVPGVAGTWKDLTDNVNLMAANLTDQVRGIAKVVTVVANGDLTKKLSVVAKGEIAALADTINGMIDTLATFAAQVTSVAREVGVEGRLGGQAQVPGAAGTWKDLTDNVNQLAANLTTQVRAIAEVATAVTKGDLTRSIRVDVRGEVETLKDTINQMIANLRATTQKNADQDWLKTNLARFTRMLQGQKDLQTVSTAILTELSKVVGAQHGAFYIAEGPEGGEPRLKLLSAFAYQPRQELAREFSLGEGLVGQCARDKEPLLITDPPDDYIRVSSGLGEGRPKNIVVLPIQFEGLMKAVLELASFGEFNQTHLAFLEQLMEGIGIVLNTLEANLRTQTLLKSLQNQQEELRKTNQALEEKADQLALTSKYKSEFLSNMSHELRTPLNSMLILSQQLAEDSKNLTEKQIEYAKTIHASGGDLLALINDILDLSKVESGTMALEIDDVPFSETRQHIERVFRHLAESKGLNFSISLDPGTPEMIRTDGKRLEQVLRNLLSNAFKFTERGQVSLEVAPANSGWNLDHPVLGQADAVLAFTVSDSGIGIPREKQKIIFEAFQQAESGTSRKYGGTGLGLSISRELAKLLGGQLSLASSVPGKGSTFVLYLPCNYVAQGPAGTAERPLLFSGGKPYRLGPRPVDPEAAAQEPLADDRRDIQPGDAVLLVVEDERAFAGVVLEAARKRGFKGVVAQDGESAIRLAADLKPDAVTLDIRLPDMDGWGVLARFKSDPAIRHIPVQIISSDEDRIRGLHQGAMAFLAKPVAREELDQALGSLWNFRGRGPGRLLLLAPDGSRRRELQDLLQGEDIRVTPVGSGQEALGALQDARFGCLVMEVPEKESQVVLQAMKKDPLWADLPVILHVTQALSKKEEALVRQNTRQNVIKEVPSLQRLVDEVSLYLHREIGRLPQRQRDLIEDLHRSGASLAGRKALVVDDDIRNIFAMTSLLEHSRMEVLSAESGKDALAVLAAHPDIDVVLMDIMMPEMDGYDTMQAIRKDERFRALPIVALTAKAMKGDRERCIEMGASDYITKPVDSSQLLALMRLWLHR